MGVRPRRTGSDRGTSARRSPSGWRSCSRPEFDKRGRLHAGVASSRTDQCFGSWSGRVVTDEGEAISVDGLQGWAEECTWRW